MSGAVVAIASLAAGTGAKMAVGSALGGFGSSLLGGIVSMGVSMIGSAILGGPKTPDYPGYSFDETGGGRTQMVRQPISYWQIPYGRVRVSGPMVFIHSNGEKNKNLYFVLPLAGCEIDAVEEIYLNDELVELDETGAATNSRWTKDGAAQVFADVHLGTANQTANQRLVDECDGQWSVDHRLRGHAYLVLKLIYDEKVFPGGIPNPSVVLRGKKVFDPRSGGTAWTDNAALCIRDYLATSRLLGGFGVSADRIGEASFLAGANVCAEDVPLKAGGTEKRYTCNGVVNTEDKPSRILEEMLVSCGGSLDVTNGKWNLHVAQAHVPVEVIDESWLIGPIEFSPKRARTELFNAVKGTFVCPSQSYQPTDYPFVVNSNYATQDGQTIYAERNATFITSPSTVQRVMKIVLEKHRMQKTIKLPCGLVAMEADPGRVYTVNLPDVGLNGVDFRVVTWQLNEDWTGVDLTMEQDGPEAYAWDPETDEQDMPEAPEVVAPDSLDNTAPGPVTSLVISASAGQIVMTWNCPEDEDFLRCKVWRHTEDDYAAAVYQGQKYANPGEQSVWIDPGVSSGVEYFYWVRTEDGDENLSNYGTAVSATAV